MLSIGGLQNVSAVIKVITSQRSRCRWRLAALYRSRQGPFLSISIKEEKKYPSICNLITASRNFKKKKTTNKKTDLLPMAFHLALTVQSESYYPDEKSINHFLLFFFLHIKCIRCRSVAWPGLVWPRRPLPQNHLNAALPLRLPYGSIATDPGRASKPLWRVDKRHPALGCKATVNLQSKNITATAGCPQLSGRVACRPRISHNSFVRHETGLTT